MTCVACLLLPPCTATFGSISCCLLLEGSERARVQKSRCTQEALSVAHTSPLWRAAQHEALHARAEARALLRCAGLLRRIGWRVLSSSRSHGAAIPRVAREWQALPRHARRISHAGPKDRKIPLCASPRLAMPNKIAAYCRTLLSYDTILSYIVR